MVRRRRMYENALSFILGNAEDWFNNNCCRDCYDNRVDYRDDLEAIADMADTNSVSDCMRYLINTGFSASSVRSAKDDIVRLLADLAQDALDEDPGDDYDEFETGDDRSYDELDDDDDYDESYIRKLESRITSLERRIKSERMYGRRSPSRVYEWNPISWLKSKFGKGKKDLNDMTIDELEEIKSKAMDDGDEDLFNKIEDIISDKNKKDQEIADRKNNLINKMSDDQLKKEISKSYNKKDYDRAKRLERILRDREDARIQKKLKDSLISNKRNAINDELNHVLTANPKWAKDSSNDVVKVFYKNIDRAGYSVRNGTLDDKDMAYISNVITDFQTSDDNKPNLVDENGKQWEPSSGKRFR